MPGFGIRTTARGIRNPTDDCNPESTDKEWDPESTARNPQSKTVLDSLIWGDE